MPAFHTFYQCAFLPHAPGRYALMLERDAAERLGRKYHERRGAITTAMIEKHLMARSHLRRPPP